MTIQTKKKRISKLTVLLKNRFESALDRVEEAKPFAKSMYQTDVFQLAIELAGSDDGMAILYENAPRFDKAGVFHGGPWEDPAKIQPPLVGGSLKLKGVYSIIELLSELRLLAIAKGDYIHEGLSKDEAEASLNEILALNLDLLFPSEIDENRIQVEDHMTRARRLFNYLGQKLSFRAIADKIVQEIDRLTVQRPIMTERILNMISMSEQLIENVMDEKTAEALKKYARAANAPTPLSKDASNQREYRLRLENAYSDELEAEAKIFARAMKDTGLVSPYHAVLLRFLNRKNPDLIPAALELSETGTASYNANRDLIHDMIQLAFFPETRQAVYGLGRMLDRGVLTQEPLVPAIRRLFELPIHSQVKQILSKPEYEQCGISLNGVLLAGVVCVLGQPL
ncbi:MAG: hypothetical protein ACXVNF_07740, partial [Neobacillus sp.]